jgi:formate hydrogenlyase subunit 3/multisubunit Na+/H+ antiporter MnhD subunit
MTTVASWLPAAVTLAPFAAVAAIYALADRPDLREAASVLTAAGGFVGMLVLARSALSGVVLESALGQIVPGIGLTLRGDPLGVLFGVIASGLWLITTLYSIGYMRGLDEHAQTRYFAAFAASVGAAFGVALSANLLALFIFYEVLTVATYPLVAHDQSPTAQAAGRKYLVYTFGGGAAVFVGTAALYLLTGTVAFTPGGIAALAAVEAPVAQALFAVLIAGFGVKAALIRRPRSSPCTRGCPMRWWRRRPSRGCCTRWRS